MPALSEAVSINLFWVNASDILSLKGFELPKALACPSFDDALRKAQVPAADNTLPWIEVNGILFSPKHIAALQRVLPSAGDRL